MEPERAVWMQPPPRLVLRLVNPVVRRLLTSPLASRLPAVMAVLEFTGRRFAVPVGVHEVQGGRVVFTEAAWRRNFTEPRDVVLRRGRDRRSGRGVLVEDPEVVADALQVALARVGARGLAMRTAPGHEPTRDDLVRLAAGWSGSIWTAERPERSTTALHGPAGPRGAGAGARTAVGGRGGS